MKILLAVDGSDYTKRMLACLLAHKEWVNTGQAITVFHSVEPLPHRAAAFAEPAVVHGYYEDDARMVLDPVRNLLAKHDIQARFEHRIGRPGVEIAAFAEKGGFDLLVMGSRGHGALAGLVLGSVATKVLAACTVPVLLVR
ncbi:universal stress protein [Variovorax sp. UMC13]|uniref:universal stress protein n=1 Tax=Variovorax sp. UMC13 TaxID=1862326 RepID=UPI00160029FE|nr:universal stress protein [Variovorax sp. UMC13]MBB1602484.1 universal stress protein UspA [Variovorax sp. UMC13]